MMIINTSMKRYANDFIFITLRSKSKQVIPMLRASVKHDVIKWFGLFCIIHLVGWTILPTFMRHNFPLDAIEGAAWGHQLEWGYDKNPFLNAWLTAWIVWMGHRAEWMFYFSSQVCIVASFIAVFLLAKQFFSDAHAFIATVLLE